MSGRHARQSRWLLLPVLALAVSAARADQKASYVIRGPAGAAIWGLGEQAGTEAVAFVFTDAEPTRGEKPATGARIAFSVIQWSFTNGVWLRRQWYGDAPLKPEEVLIALDLSEGRLDATVRGTLEEQRLDGSILRREVPGRFQVRWAPFGGIGNLSEQVNYQTPAYAASLQLVGSGRKAAASATLVVEGFDGPIQITGLGTLSSVKDGLFNLTLR
jgi:hypothetical protein